MPRIKNLIYWLKLCKFAHHPLFIIPFILGVAIAWSEGYSVNVAVVGICIISIVLLTAGSLISNDYFDYETDRLNFERIVGEYGYSTTGGSQILVRGLIPVRQALAVSYILLIAGLLPWVIIQFQFDTGMWTIPLAVFGWMSLMYFYSGKPLQLSYHGLGEIAVAFGFGVVAPLTGYYIVTHRLSWIPVVISLPWIIDSFKLKLTRELPDWKADKAAGRRNLVVRLGEERIASIYNPLTLIAYASFIILIPFEVPLISLLLLIPPAFFTLRSSIAMHQGKWKQREGLSYIVLNAFVGMFLIPLALIGIFILKTLL